MKNLYDEDYYERGLEKGISCYSNYRWIPELTIPMAATLIEYLNIKPSDLVLDFGCAKGYLVKAMRLLHRKAYGFDISDYAREEAPEDVKEYVYGPEWKQDRKYQWCIAKDVFEHIPYEMIQHWLKSIRKTCEHLFAAVPLGEDGCTKGGALRNPGV